MFRIRAATVIDLPALASLWYEKSVLQADRRLLIAPDALETWTRAATAWLDDPRCGIFVAEGDGGVIGYIVGWAQPLPGMTPGSIGLITELALDAHGYHGGVGRALVDALKAWFAGQGIEQLAVWTPRFDAVGQAFWRSLGATEWVDVLWMKS